MHANIEVIENALILPSENGQPKAAGVFDDSGNTIEAAVHMKGKNRPFNAPVFYPTHSTQDVDTAIFGGFMFSPHFGHMVTESTTRLWATEILKPGLPILYLPAWSISDSIPEVFQEIARQLGIKGPLRLLSSATRVKTLFVPSQLFGLGPFLRSHPTFKRFVQQLKNGYPTPTRSGNKVFVSRAQLLPWKGNILMEHVLEKNLSAQGYRIFHPENHSLDEQLSVYASASTLIFTEGSAIHLYGLVAHRSQRVGIIARRFSVAQFIEQIESFSGAQAQSFQHVQGLIMPVRSDFPAAFGASLVDFDALGTALLDSGFIEDKASWALAAKPDLHADIQKTIRAFGGQAQWASSPEEMQSPARLTETTDLAVQGFTR